MEIFADKPARVSRSMDTLQTCGIAPKVLKCIRTSKNLVKLMMFLGFFKEFKLYIKNVLKI